ncbi:MAG: hypothetical protein M0R80_30855 [Proteobacteria bacterium]|jgi:hypothetical protein|nr:hypothetical protein [Pseudomonadota bacterium]
MMARLTLSDGFSITAHNVALYSGDRDVSLAGPADGESGGGGAGGEPDRCEFSLPRKVWEKLRSSPSCEIELSNGAVVTVTDLDAIRNSRSAPNVRVRGRAGNRRTPGWPDDPPKA